MYIALFVILTVLISYYIKYLKLVEKNKNIFNDYRKYLYNIRYYKKNNFILNKIKEKEQLLIKLDFPYKLTLKRYLFIKYILSILIFSIAFINYKNLKIPTTVFFTCFYLCDYLIYSYKKKENIILISEIKKINTSIILLLSSGLKLKDAIIAAKKVLCYGRFTKEYEKFVYRYNNNGYLLKDAIDGLVEKFNSYELKLYLNTLLSLEEQGNIIEGLDKYSETIDISYMKYIKRQQEKQLGYMVLGTIVLMVNITASVIYPIGIEVLENLKIIFT